MKLRITLEVDDVELKYNHKLPSEQEIITAIEDAPDHLMWLLEGSFTAKVEYLA